MVGFSDTINHLGVGRDKGQLDLDNSGYFQVLYAGYPAPQERVLLQEALLANDHYGTFI